MSAEAFEAATFRRLVPAPGSDMPAPGSRIVAGTLVEETAAQDAGVVQLTGRIR